MLKLTLSKPGDAPVQKLKLNLHKNGKFTVEMSWTSDNDPDVGALLAVNSGQGAKVSERGQILSTYNCHKTNSQGFLKANDDGSFSTPEGALRHSGDCLTGKPDGVCETITVDTGKIPATCNEIPIFITIHPPEAGKKFNSIQDCILTVKGEDGEVAGQYKLTDEFANFEAVQLGSFIKADTGWEYAPVGVGFDCGKAGFNKILENFTS